MNLTKDGLVLALVSIVTRETPAETGGVVADTTAGAVTSLLRTVAVENIRAGGALLEGAVGATEAEVAAASDVLCGIPGGRVRGASSGGEGGLGHAHATVVAVGGADGTLTSHALVVVEALALAGLAVAGTLVGALDRGVGVVGSSCDGNPGEALGASAEGAVVLSPRGVAVGALVARALVCRRFVEVSGFSEKHYMKGSRGETRKRRQLNSAKNTKRRRKYLGQ
jgi:hypothetical protein